MSAASEEVILIKPLSPHPSVIPNGITLVPIPGVCIWPLGDIPAVYVFPGQINVERLKNAIALLSSIYPSICGRFVSRRKIDKEGYDFYYDLTQSLIPLSIRHLTQTQTQQDDDDERSKYPSNVFKDRSIIQDSLEPFLHPLGKDYIIPNSDAYLFSIRLTYLSNYGRSVLGLNHSHIIGDGQTSLNLLHCLEKLYIHGDERCLESNSGTITTIKNLELPTFFYDVDLPPYDPKWNLRKKEVIGHPVPELIETYKRNAQGLERLNVILSQDEINKLKSQVLEFSLDHDFDDDDGGLGGTKKIKLSDQDIISGWWIDLHNRTGQDIGGVTYVINWRDYIRPNLSAAAGNIGLMHHFTLPTCDARSLKDIYRISKTIRKEISLLQTEPEVFLPLLSHQEYHLHKSAEEGKGQILTPDQGEVLVNSNIRMNWHLSFGFPIDQVEYYTDFTAVRTLRVYPANPILGRESEKRGVELMFKVPAKLRTVFEDLIKSDRGIWAT
ncbi:uncharacterized protein IL334_007677 [Kwoniella shivajii]|uniref:Uncharacterized protein n=1 Tax=Kwoniella shivajii TaxID=564305 RepID=A0ABZ1DB61_9TREE|nr:hypothetical protein IL334_007677 [Kwoniella shivajii]